MLPTQASNRDIAARKTVRISEFFIIYGFLNSKIWQYFFTDKWPKIFDLCLWYYFRFSRAIIALNYSVVIRYRFGKQTFGLLAYLTTISTCIGYNSLGIHPALKPFAMWITPILVWGKTKEELYVFLCEDIESQFLLVYSGFLILSGLVHLITIWIGKGNASISKRGDSYLVWLLSRRLKVNEFFIVAIVEPILFLGIGAILWIEFDDHYGAIFLAMATIGETIQQWIDQAHKEHLKSILKT